MVVGRWLLVLLVCVADSLGLWVMGVVLGLGLLGLLTVVVCVRVCWLSYLLFDGLLVWLIVLLCMFLLYITCWSVCLYC